MTNDIVFSQSFDQIFDGRPEYEKGIIGLPYNQIITVLKIISQLMRD